MSYAEEIMQNIMLFMPLMKKNFQKGWPIDSDLLSTHMEIMGFIKTEGPLSMKEISYFLGISAPNLTVLVDKLVSKGLLDRVSSHLDRRIIKVVLSDKGDAYMEQIKTIIIKHMESKLSSLSQEEKGTLLDSIKKIRQILSKVK